MRIVGLAAPVGRDVQTLRFYEREGSLAPPDREASGYRSYADEAISSTVARALRMTPTRVADA
jgi:DNA-binding transcriptional MerR regulator